MLLANVEGSVVATMKDAHVAGRKLLLVRPQFVDDRNPARFRAGRETLVAVDTVGAGVGEMVVICQGSPARLAPDLMNAPVDAVVMGIVDVVDMLGQQCYSSKT
ncbi:MAG: EutN/CcmL family microcompartment protein [Verrucomicrobia bacterium]|nr:EutN/CcmL family microcompartment protein [Verrucomicrobiota bacterium]